MSDQDLRELSEGIRQSHQTKHSVTKQRNQQARQIEEELRTHLNDIVSRIVHADISDISLLQRQYSDEVTYVIRAAANNAYSVGLNYVGGMKKRLHHIFHTASDIDNVKKITSEYTHVFWRRVSAVLHQKDVIQNIRNARFSTRSKLSLTNLISSLAAKVVTKSVAIATIEKVRALSTASEVKSAAQSSMLDIPVEVLVWTTARDELVCPLCASLDGMEWSADDPNMLTPPDDSHDNCRCTLDMSGEGERGTLGLDEE